MQGLACLTVLAGGCVLAAPQSDAGSDGEPGSSGTGNAATSGSAGQSETGIVAPMTATGGGETSAVTTTADATSLVTTTDDTHSFIWRLDAGSHPDECDTFAQDCPRGQKCMPWANDGGSSWNATRCVDIAADPKQVGQACTAIGDGVSGEDDCELGAMCWDVDEQLHGSCIALCGGTAESPSCPPGSTCNGGRSVLSLCLPDCSPLLQDCPGTDLCIPVADSFHCVLDASGEQGQAHDPCEFANACDKGLVCLDAALASSLCDPEMLGCCEPFCEFPDGACPAPDQECRQWFDPQDLPMDDPKLAFGVCARPE